MPLYDFDVLALVQELENETYLAEALLFPELCRHEDTGGQSVGNLRNSLLPFLDKLEPARIHGRRGPQSWEVREISMEVKPAKRTRSWNEPVPLTFHAVCWQRPGSYHAFVPALTIEVVADSEEALLEILPRNIESELQRRGASASLRGLIFQQRVVGLEVEKTQVNLNVMTVRQRVEALTKQPVETSTLKEVGTLLNSSQLPRAYEMEKQVEQLARLLVGRNGRSVLMVGPSGVGKTAVGYELVRRRRFHRLGQTQFWETTGARLMVGADSFGDWQQRCRRVLAEAAKKRAVLMLGNLFELAEIGRSGSCPEGMAGFFRPYLDRGDVLVVVECTPEQRDAMEREHAHLLSSFSVMTMDKPESKTVASILLSVAAHERVGLEAIENIERLHRRYATYSAYPGRPLRFLKELMAEVKGEIGGTEVAESFARESGLPQFLVDDSLPLELEKTQEFFSTRILGQEEAVGLVVDLLASIKAALSPPGKPIASLLFIGPTGVGKTEMARTLAQYLFRDRKRMVRFDMSEFADPYAVERLVGGQGGGQGLLTSKVREQPFGVVLFDELEKADPAFFDLLLQILGEGRLTDASGRVADFTNSLVVMTSNLGAASFSKGPLGFRTAQADSKAQARQQFVSAVKAAFRPELFNRIDRLVPFAPLDRETATKVADRELAALHTRDGVLHGHLELEIAPEVAGFLAEQGYDRRYGARPLKRAIEKRLLGPLSERSNEAGQKGQVAKVSVVGGDLQLDFAAREEAPKSRFPRVRTLPFEALEGRRKAQRVSVSQPAHELRNALHRLQRLKARHIRRKFVPKDEGARVARLPLLEKLAKKVEATVVASRELETSALLGFQGYEELPSDLGLSLQQQQADLKRLMLELYAIGFEDPHRATVIIYRGNDSRQKPLLEAYFALFKKLGISGNCYRLTLGTRVLPEEPDGILRLGIGEEVENRALHCERAPLRKCYATNLVGVAVELSGDMVLPLMNGESGLHFFTAPYHYNLEVVVGAQSLADYVPPEELHLRRELTGAKRRTYSQGAGVVEDPRLNRRYAWSGKSLETVLAHALPLSLEKAAEAACQ